MATRRERVVLDLESNLPEGMLRGAVATEVLRKELDRLSGTSVQTSRATANIDRDMDRVAKSADNAGGSINQLTGRIRVLGEVSAILGPALAPLGGVAFAGVAGLASQLGFAAVAGGVLIGSLQGVGDALDAMNKAQLEPTDKNLEKAHDALKALSPAARDFAREAFALKPALTALRDIGAEALMPGLTESLESIEELGPRVAGIMRSLGEVLGDIASNSSASLASERWAGFFDFIQVEGPKTLSELASTVGDLTHGMVELWQAFTPLNNDFSSWLMDVANGFDEWATGLDQTQGFQEFVDYIRATGPQVADTLAALGNAVVQIVQATAPLGGPVLAAIEGFAKAVGAIADSDLGTPIFAGVAALSLLNRTLAVTAALSKTSLSGGLFSGLGTASGGIKKGTGSIRADLAAMSDTMVAFGANTEKAGAAAERMKGRFAGLAKGGAALGGLALASSGAADGLGLTNTASLALMGTVAGPWGVAIGAGAGLLLDWKAAGDQAAQATADFETRLKSMSLDQLNAELETTNTLLATKPGVDEDEGAADREKRADQIRDQIEATKELEAAEVGRSRRAAVAYASEAGLNANLSKWRHRSVEDIKAAADALTEVRKQAEATGQSFLGFGDSLNDSKVSLKDFISDMQESANALANFNNNSLKAARRGLDEGLIASLRQAGAEGALRMKQLANATESEIARANKAHRSQQRELERTADIAAKLAGMDPVVKVKAETAGAMNDINGLEARLRAIKDEDVNIVVRQIGATTLGPRNEAADGGSVPKTGKPYADRHLYLLADGEEVISNRHGQADRHRSLLKAINGGLADGGTTGKDGKKPKRSFSFTDNTEALQAAIDRLTMVAEDQTRAVDKAAEKTQKWSDRMADVAQATVSGFSTSLFDRGQRGVAGGGAIANLTKDIGGLQQRGNLQKQLAAMGLSGDALAALLGEGTNADIAGLIASGQVSQYAALFDQRAALQSSVGAAAGQAAYGGQAASAAAEQKVLTDIQRRSERRLANMEAQLATANELLANVGSDVTKGVNSTASATSRHGGGKYRPKASAR